MWVNCHKMAPSLHNAALLDGAGGTERGQPLLHNRLRASLVSDTESRGATRESRVTNIYYI